jgi:hypothetical protein
LFNQEYYIRICIKFKIWTQRYGGLWCLMPLSTILVISWQSDLLIEETGVPGENDRPVANHWSSNLYHMMLFRVHLAWAEFELIALIILVYIVPLFLYSNSHVYYLKLKRWLRPWALFYRTSTVIKIKILIIGHFLLTFRISLDHFLPFFVNISDFNGTFSDGMW